MDPQGKETISRVLYLPIEIKDQIIDHILSCLPEEGCGILGGVENRVHQALPIRNSLRSRVRFRMEPQAQLRGFQQIERQGLQLVAFFHSHPEGPPVPSETDLFEFMYPGVLSVIVSPGEDLGWQMRAFDLDCGAAIEVVIVLCQD